MKLAICANENSLDGPLAERFGRSPGFLLIDGTTNRVEWINNEQSRSAEQGAGVQAAQTLVDRGVEAVLAVHCGPKAFAVLREAGIELLTTHVATAGQALESFRAGQLHAAPAADVRGHWV